MLRALGINLMTRLTSILLCASLLGCATSDDPNAAELALAGADAIPTAGAADAASAGWVDADTLHVGASVYDRADAGSRRVHPLWVAGTAAAPVAITVDVTALGEEGATVRVAVLGPLVNGTRAVLAAGGYAARAGVVSVDVDVATTGEHLVVVGSYKLATAVVYDLVTHCTGARCGAAVDVLATPKAGALVATENGRLLQATLGDVLDARTSDIELEVYRSSPMVTWDRELVATSVASGNQVNMILPASVLAGDDLTLVVREAGGRVLDTGLIVRFAPEATSLVRLDAILYGDIASLQVAGVTSYFEGVADLELRSVTHGRSIAEYTARAANPGMEGTGFGAFDASFLPALEVDGALNPALPRNGELLSVGAINGNGDFAALGCFEYCNDLSGEATCTGGPRTCPAGF